MPHISTMPDIPEKKYFERVRFTGSHTTPFYSKTK